MPAYPAPAAIIPLIIAKPAVFDAGKSSSMGLKLAASLARQLGGRLEFTSCNGCRVQADLARLCPQPASPQPAVPAARPDPAALIGARMKRPSLPKSLSGRFSDPSCSLS